MKICFLTTVSITLKTFVVAQAEYIHQKHPDWQITFVCDHDEDFGKSLPDHIRYMPISMSRGVDVKGIATVLSLTKLFKKEKFDMIVYATPNAALYASLAGRLAGVKKRLYCQWGIRYVGFSGMSRRIFKALEKITCRNSTYINAVSAKNRQFAIDEGLYKAAKASVVGNGGTIGVDLERYDLSKAEQYRTEKRNELDLGNHFVFGFVGRLTRDKGVAELLEAMRRLSADHDVKLICVGADELSEKDVPADVKAWAETAECICFTGSKPADEVIKYYAAMDAYVHPTYREGFGMVLQEAAAMACPVITTNVPGASEVLEENNSCLLAQARDVDSLTECMRKLCEDADLCKRLGASGRALVEQRYERSGMLENQLKRYEELLGE